MSKETKKKTNTKKIPKIEFGFDKKFDKFVEDIDDKAKKVIDKVLKPLEIYEDKKVKVSYYSPSFRKRVNENGRAGSIVLNSNETQDTFLHEYGHHIDFSLAIEQSLKEKSISGSDFFWEARLKDIEHLKKIDTGEFKGLYSYLSNEWKGKKNMGEMSDIFDAMTKGSFHDRYGMPGHGQGYYSKKGKKNIERNRVVQMNKKEKLIKEHIEKFGAEPIEIGMFWKNSEILLENISKAIKENKPYNEYDFLTDKEKKLFDEGYLLF